MMDSFSETLQIYGAGLMLYFAIHGELLSGIIVFLLFFVLSFVVFIPENLKEVEKDGGQSNLP